MIQSATRIAHISEYYFAQKLRAIARMQAEGKSIINLGIGSPDLPPSPDVAAALLDACAHPHAHAYQSYTGILELRKAWADWYQRWYGVTLNPADQILPLMGSKEGILHIAMSFLDAGDEALLPNPGYPTYRAATELAGGQAVYYDLDANHGWLPDLKSLAARDLSRVKIMWVNYPHMPTGAVANAAFFQELVDFGRAHQILIVNDNPYSFILNDTPISILAAEGASEWALELNSLSKSHNMAGWRMGLVAGNPAYLQAILRFKSNMDSGQFYPMQKAAAVALALPDAWYHTLNAQYRIRQQHAFALLDALGCTYRSDQQGLFVWAKIPDHYADGYALSDALLDQTGVFLTPGGIFGSAGKSYVRISLCSETAVLATATHRIQTLLKHN
jgi:aspartate/methionine/tyrosine aminotransferase